MNVLIRMADECYEKLHSAGLKKGEINAVCDIIRAYARTSNAQRMPKLPHSQQTFTEQLQEGFL